MPPSIYGSGSPNLTGMTRGGTSTGFRGGAGKPGYPVPSFPEEDENLKEAIWYKPPASQEHDELTRISREENIPMAVLVQAYHNAQLVDLDDQLWSSIEGTDSWRIDDLPDAQQAAKKSGANLSPVVAGLQSNSRMPSPIVLKRADGSVRLVGGNARLMAAKAMKVRPKVALMRIESIDRSNTIVEGIVNMVIKELQAGALFTQTGGVGHRAGSSSWSAPMDQMTDEDEEGQGLWQNQLTNLNIR
jgi:hypothetical protein